MSASLAASPTGYPVGARFRPIMLLRSAPLPIWLITGLFAALLASWSVLVPQYHAPDEPNHVDAVMRLVQGAGWPHPGHAFVRPDGVGTIAASPYGTDKLPYDLGYTPIAKDDATPRGDRPTWDEMGDTRQPDGEPQPPGEIQQLVQHPPLYYWVGAAVLWALPGGDGDDLRWDVTIGILRLMSALMVAPIPLLAWAGAHRLSDGNRVASTCAALVPLAIPQLTHIGSSVNNDNLLALTAGLATVTIVYILCGDTSLRTTAWAGAFIGLALFSKSLAIVLVPMAALAYLVAWRRARRDAHAPPALPRRGPDAPFLLAETGLMTVPPGSTRAPWRQLLLGGALMTGFGGWWWVVNVVRYRTFQPETPGFPLGDYLNDWGDYTEVLVNGTILRWWGSFGWFEANLPTEFVRSASVAVVVLFALAIIRGRNGRTRVNLLFLLWPTIGLFGLMTLQSALAFADHHHVSGISGRYLYAGLPSLAIGVGMGVLAFGRRASRAFPTLFFAAAAAAQWWSIKTVLPYFWKPPGGDLADAWDAMTAWSPWPPAAAVTTVWIGAAFALAVLVSCVWIAFRPGSETDPDPAGSAPLGLDLADSGPAVLEPVDSELESSVWARPDPSDQEPAPPGSTGSAPVNPGSAHSEAGPTESARMDSAPVESDPMDIAPVDSMPVDTGSPESGRSQAMGTSTTRSTAKGDPPSVTSPVPSH